MVILILILILIMRTLYINISFSYICSNRWRDTNPTTLEPLIILQKKTIRIITFSSFDAHTTPLFHRLEILKFIDLIFIYKQCRLYV